VSEPAFGRWALGLHRAAVSIPTYLLNDEGKRLPAGFECKAALAGLLRDVQEGILLK
jgi:hypothetical protein